MAGFDFRARLHEGIVIPAAVCVTPLHVVVGPLTVSGKRSR